MSLPVRLHPLAEDDLVETWAWYEAQESGLGKRFFATVHATIAQVADWPNSGSPVIEVDGEVIERRVGTKGFPYLVRYRIVDNTVVVVAVYHQRRSLDFGAGRQI
ncbi:MAG: type II toxin-antitoxin system RelE/ParE family toxin [Acidimicrobiales bacterium]|jgi:plasmid stabilization system protein ParE